MKRGDRIRYHFWDPPDLDQWDFGIILGVANTGERLVIDLLMEDANHFGNFYSMTVFHEEFEIIEPMSYEELCTHPEPRVREIANEQRATYESRQHTDHSSSSNSIRRYYGGR